MRILAIETIETAGSVALLDGQHLVAETRLDASRRSARTLAPGIHDLLFGAGWTPREVELVAVATGPGSFTGLRIGVTTAKSFAYATGCGAVGVNSLLAIAERMPAATAAFHVVLDAQRNELFVGDFTRAADGRLSGEETTRIVTAEAWIAELPAGAIVTGPGLTKWAQRLGGKAILVEESLWHPTASAVGRLGLAGQQGGGRARPLELVPRYFRRTAAEEQWERKASAKREA
ncbi:MAG: tRNA (adenosine(37)-N6)-threonylcarbamoyltransferase complex dimerization subunit type 1 TsaB [Planctomycetota bacterium]|nr:MAG: tRNA (adenosine(37)-N6)-threonylcarbamoyltransferase complex dimerization subunit type 1 TsaB [Planctomycetota bacterium]